MGSLNPKYIPNVPAYTPDHPSLLHSIINVLRSVMLGKTRNVYTVTLTANSATTTVTISDGTLGSDTAVFFMPTTANAATEFGAGTMYVSSRTVQGGATLTGSFVITHVNNAQTDRTFYYILVG